MTEVICLEGCKGTGKTTHTKLLATYLRSIGQSHFLVNECKYQPYRGANLNWHQRNPSDRYNWPALERLAKARGEMHDKELRPKLGKYDSLVFDGCYLTDVVRRSVRGIPDPEEILSRNIYHSVIPITRGIILECPPEESEARARNREQNIGDDSSPAVHENVTEIARYQRMYQRFAERHTNMNLKIINSNRTVDEVFKDIQAYLFNMDYSHETVILPSTILAEAG